MQKEGEHFNEAETTQSDSQSTTKKKNEDNRLRCINCCEKCVHGKCNPVRKAGEKMERQQLGRKTIWYCPTCGVVLCKSCWDTFHSKDIELPSCSPFLHMISNSTRCIEVDRENKMMFIRRRQVSPREEEIDCEGENTEEEDEVVETVCEALANMRRTARTGKTYSPRKKGQKKKRGVTEDEDEESKQSDENETPMRQVLRVSQN